MKSITVPVLIVFGITVYAAALFFLHYVYTREKENLMFSLSCVSFAVYNVYGIALYNSSTVVDSMLYQKLQILSLGAVMIFLFMLIIEFTRHGHKRTRNIFTLISVLFLVAITVMPDSLVFAHENSGYRYLHFFNVLQYGFYEPGHGPVIMVFTVYFLTAALYIFYVLIVNRHKGHDMIIGYRSTRMIGVALIIFAFTGINDVFVAFRLYNSIYLIEFGYMAIIIFMSFSLTANHSILRLKLKRSIIDQKIAFDRLEKSELRLKNIIENANELIFTLSKGFYITYLSPAWEKMLGYPIADSIGRSWFSFIHENDRAFFNTIFVKKESEHNIEYRIIHSNGKLIWHRATCTPVFNSTGDIIYFVILSQDIMESRQALEALRFSEERLHNIIENANDIIYSMTPGGTLMYVSPAWQRLLGHKIQNIEGRSIQIYIHDDDTDDFNEYLKQIYAIPNVNRSIEYRIRHNNGSWRWFRSTLSVVRDQFGRVDYLVGINQDITSIKESEHRLHESEQRLEMALDAAQLGLWDWNLYEEKVFFDKSWQHILGFNPEEVGSDYEKLIKFIHTDDLPAGLTAIKDHIDGKTPNFEAEYRVKTLRNTFIWILVKGKIFERDRDGKPLRAVGTYMDISRTKKAAEELKASLQEKEILLREIHHRVKNNFQIIISLLNLQRPGINDERVIKIFSDYHSRIRSMALIHEKMYHSSELSKIDFSDYARSIVNEISSMYLDDYKDVTMVNELEKVYLDIENAIPCGLILNEVVTNIFKYAFPENYRENPRITLKIDQTDDDRVEVTIADNGIGMSADIDIKKSNTLGLQLIHILAENQLKGTVTVTRDNGTCFIFSFPIKKVDC